MLVLNLNTGNILLQSNITLLYFAWIKYFNALFRLNITMLYFALNNNNNALYCSDKKKLFKNKFFFLDLLAGCLAHVNVVKEDGSGPLNELQR